MNRIHGLIWRVLIHAFAMLQLRADADLAR